MGPVPVTVLTGALGAGKTTLLNAALRGGAIRNAAVVVNEFGAVGIDNALIEASSEDIVLLPGGCVCCQVRADLAEALTRLGRSVAQGDIPAFERVVVETSGLAEPGPILQLFAESALLVGRYRLDAVVCVVDGLLGGAALEEDGSACRQAQLADRIVISKTETAAPDAMARLHARLGQLNPSAAIVPAARDEAPADWFAPAPPGPAKHVPPGLLRAAHDEAVTCFVLEWNQPQPLAAIGDWLNSLAGNYGARLLRVKGIVAAVDVEMAVAVHAVQHLVAPPDFLAAPGDGSRVVLITRGLEPGDVAPPWPHAAGAAQAPLRGTAGSRPLLPHPAGASSAAAFRR